MPLKTISDLKPGDIIKYNHKFLMFIFSVKNNEKHETEISYLLNGQLLTFKFTTDINYPVDIVNLD